MVRGGLANKGVSLNGHPGPLCPTSTSMKMNNVNLSVPNMQASGSQAVRLGSGHQGLSMTLGSARTSEMKMFASGTQTTLKTTRLAPTSAQGTTLRYGVQPGFSIQANGSLALHPQTRWIGQDFMESLGSLVKGTQSLKTTKTVRQTMEKPSTVENTEFVVTHLDMAPEEAQETIMAFQRSSSAGPSKTRSGQQSLQMAYVCDDGDTLSDKQYKKIRKRIEEVCDQLSPQRDRLEKGCTEQELLAFQKKLLPALNAVLADIKVNWELTNNDLQQIFNDRGLCLVNARSYGNTLPRFLEKNPVLRIDKKLAKSYKHIHVFLVRI